MRLPRRIDDRLKDAIVSIQFTPGIPPVTLLGYAHATLKESFDPIVTGPFPAFNLGAEGITIDNRQVYFLSKDKRFRIDIDGESITFNSTQGYAGWAAYRTVIIDCMNALLNGAIIRQVNRVGVRYISRFDNIRVGDSIDLQLVVKAVSNISRSQLRLEFMQNGFHTILTLVDGYPAETQSEPNASFFSLIDVDIIKYYPPEQSVHAEMLFNDIDTAHHEQKVLFFGLLKEEFLKTLNPEY